MQIVITGGSGYIGATLAAELLARGHGVHAVDVLLHGQQAVADGLRKQGVDVVVGDITDRAVLARVRRCRCRRPPRRHRRRPRVCS